jgi:hypothetical protein
VPLSASPVQATIANVSVVLCALTFTPPSASVAVATTVCEPTESVVVVLTLNAPVLSAMTGPSVVVPSMRRVTLAPGAVVPVYTVGDCVSELPLAGELTVGTPSTHVLLLLHVAPLGQLSSRTHATHVLLAVLHTGFEGVTLQSASLVQPPMIVKSFVALVPVAVTPLLAVKVAIAYTWCKPAVSVVELGVVKLPELSAVTLPLSAAPSTNTTTLAPDVAVPTYAVGDCVRLAPFAGVVTVGATITHTSLPLQVAPCGQSVVV